jgi:hypothetical protein
MGKLQARRPQSCASKKNLPESNRVIHPVWKLGERLDRIRHCIVVVGVRVHGADEGERRTARGEQGDM